MNIALLIESLDGGGSERVVRRLALGLAQHGQRVFVYCLGANGVTLNPCSMDGVVIREARSVGCDPLLAWRLARWLRRDRIDVAHAHSCAALVWVMPAARLLGIPLVHAWHGWPLNHPTREHRLALYLDRFVDRVIINSESLRCRLPAYRSTRAAVCIRNGVDLAPAAPSTSRQRLNELCGRVLDGPVLLSVGNIRAEKDFCGLVRAVARLRRQWPHIQLVCVGAVGDSNYWRAVRDTTRTLRLHGNVHFPGPYADAWRLMAGADAFCLSSRTESLPNVVLEAMSQRVPIVATAVGDVGSLAAPFEPGRWLLQHNVSGLLVPPGDPAALAAAVGGTLRHPAAARARATRALRYYQQHWTVAPMVHRYERVYEKCCRTRQRRPADRPDRQRRAAVLMLGPAPPQIGGMVTSIDLLMKSPLQQRFTLHRCATPARPMSQHARPPRGPFQRALALPDSFVRHMGALARLTATIVNRRIDVVHIHTCSHFTFYRNLLDLAVAKWLGRAVVLHIRGGQFERFCASAGRGGRWLIRRGCEAADAVVVLSERWRAALQPFLGNTRVYVIPNGAEVPALERHRPANSPTCRFLYLATLTPAKGLVDLLGAATTLRRQHTPFELLIAGPAAEGSRAVWERHIREAGLADVTRMAGPVTGPEKTQLLAEADCFVHPSHSEGMPNAILEAAAAGLPVIATAVGSVPELMHGDDGPEPLAPLVAPRDPAGLASAMQLLAADPVLRHRIGARLRQRVASDYSLAVVASRVGRLYDSVLSEDPP